MEGLTIKVDQNYKKVETGKIIMQGWSGGEVKEGKKGNHSFVDIHDHSYVYVYINRERERAIDIERDIDRCICIFFLSFFFIGGDGCQDDR